MIIYKAIDFATYAHRNQTRKGTDMPYISHPIHVGMMLLKNGCEDEVVAAGILHDVVEDTDVSIEQINNEFGEKVAMLVNACTEPPRRVSWYSRKQHTIDFLKTASYEICMIVCADKLHNLRTMYQQFLNEGDAFWRHFYKGRSDQEWYYRSIIESLRFQLEKENDFEPYQAFKKEVNLLFPLAIELDKANLIDMPFI